MKEKSGKKSLENSAFDTHVGALFAQKLLQWNASKNKRQMPWKGEKDPYKIWLSEVILQQTRVEQGLKYYENFIKTFPSVEALAHASEDKVFKLWEGLGYYSRCRNLITTARYITDDLKGKFPADYDSILLLKGVGTYTAAAIGSFAYNLPYAVLDGNVFRVLTRIFDIETPIDSPEGKKKFAQIAQSILPKERSGEYNQAIMDFGAVICKPSPECGVCFFNKHCKAYLSGKQDLLPVKEKKIKVKDRWLNYLVVCYKDQVLIRQRMTKDIWQQLFEFVLIESGKALSPSEILKEFERQYGIKEYQQGGIFETNQRLSHQMVHFTFILLDITPKTNLTTFSWIKSSELEQYAFPKTLQQFISTHLS
jgi:A/G-specific adenine glycosylase